MKTMKYLSMLFMMMAMTICMTSCSDDDDPTSDYASAISGVYTGKLTVNGSVIEDAYVVRVEKISSTVVCVRAAFYSNGEENYNITYQNGQYIFESESSVNITITVTGKAINISFLNKDGSITNFNSVRD